MKPIDSHADAAQEVADALNSGLPEHAEWSMGSNADGTVYTTNRWSFEVHRILREHGCPAAVKVDNQLVYV